MNVVDSQDMKVRDGPLAADVQATCVPCDAAHSHLQAPFPPVPWTAQIIPCTTHTGQMQLWGSQAALPIFQQTLADKEKPSLTQVKWYRGLHWNSALLKFLPKTPGLGFHFMWHTDLSLTVTDITGCSEPSSHLNQPNKDPPSQALDNAQAPTDFKMGTVILMISQMIWKGNSWKGHWFVSLHL